MEYLIHSSGAQPIEKTIKIHELKTKYEKKYCLWFQNGSCRFGKACKKLHEIDPDYKKKIPEEKKEINNDKKRNPTKFQKKHFVPNNFNNKIAGAPFWSEPIQEHSMRKNLNFQRVHQAEVIDFPLRNL